MDICRYIAHHFFIHSPIDGHIGCFHILAMVNKKYGTLCKFACHLCVGAMLIFASFHFYYMCCQSEHADCC